MIEIKTNETKNISLKIKTVVIDPEAVDMGEEEILSLLKRMADGENVEKEVEEIMDSEAQSEIELCTEASMILKDDGCVEISYMENEDDEQLTELLPISELSFISEYGYAEDARATSLYLGEYAKEICKENAVETLGRIS